ncbi:hypothetical protein Tco_0073675 [Tanacetum coccineum]
MDDPNITMEEYIRLEEEKASKRGKVFNWETAKYGRIWYDEDVHDLRSVENIFPAIVFNDSLTSDETLSCEPTVSSLNDEIDFRILFDDSDYEDYTIRRLAFRLDPKRCIRDGDCASKRARDDIGRRLTGFITRFLRVDLWRFEAGFAEMDRGWSFCLELSFFSSVSDDGIGMGVRYEDDEERSGSEGYATDCSLTTFSGMGADTEKVVLLHHYGLGVMMVGGLSVVARGKICVCLGVGLHSFHGMSLFSSNICFEIGDDWAWVALEDTERQAWLFGGTCAPRALLWRMLHTVVVEEVQADPETCTSQPQHAIPPLRIRSGTSAATTTTSCCGTLRGLVERSMPDQGRFSTWMISCMTRLLEASGQTFQAFDGTFWGSSPAVFQRRTRIKPGSKFSTIVREYVMEPSRLSTPKSIMKRE